jgi:hypothetical protein
MKVYDIPAYSYFAETSFRTDFTLLCDNAVCAYYEDMYDDANFHTLYSESGSTYNNIATRVKNILGFNLLNGDLVLHQVYNTTSRQPMAQWYNRIQSLINVRLNAMQVSDNYDMPGLTTGIATPTSVIGLNTLPIPNSIVGNINRNWSFYHLNNSLTINAYFSTSTHTFQIEIPVFPEDIIVNNALISRADYNALPQHTILFRVEIGYTLDSSDNITDLSSYKISVALRKDNGYNSLAHMFGDFSFVNSGINIREYDDNNPYGEGGNSEPGGGDGTLPPGGLDYIDPTEIPGVPTLSASDCGFMTIYNPSVSQLQALASFMWSGAFDLDTYKKLFSDPMESIIGLAIVPVAPDIGGAKNVMFGTIDSGVNMSYVSSQYKKIDCGSVDIQKYVGCFMDYSPYTKISIYLPYIGIRDLSPDDITGGSINVTYIVDVLSGSCACFISHSVKGVLYSFNGSCISNIPLTASNFSGAIQNAVSAVISGVGVIAGMATGAAPVTAMGVAGLVNSAANTALNSKPHIQRSGNLGGSAGIMSVQKPFIIIERPNLSVPSNVQHYVGQTSNLTRTLGNCSGFTMVEYIHLHGIPATSEEITEIETLLKQGVIL